ncbi:MAG: hypothetical protein FGM18_04150 [Burkholderiaceae bacterium]|nr:hypothetical protein [Burkholderiaceae bacterium]
MALTASSFLRMGLLLTAVASMALGVTSGLARIGWPLADWPSALAGQHGPLMMSAFFGTVISLERAVALNTKLSFVAPIISAASGLVLLLLLPASLAAGLAILASMLLAFASIEVLRRMLAPFTITLFLATLCWLIASLTWWLTGIPATATPWWILFLVITIAGERLELTRFVPVPESATLVFYGLIAAALSGAGLASMSPRIGFTLMSVGIFGLAIWLMRFDIARHNLSQSGATRYIAICLFTGYIWLALAGLFGLFGGFETSHRLHDATLHTIAIGFVFSMVFGHALIIFPAIARIKISFHRILYLPLVLLWISLSIRVLGQIFDNFLIRQYGALINGLTLLTFAIVLISRMLIRPSAAAYQPH